MNTDKLRERVRSGDQRAAKNLSRIILRSDSARIAAVAFAVNRKLPFLKDHPELPLAIVKDGLALNMWEDSGESVTWKLYETTSGKPRPNYRFGFQEYARQHFARRVADPMADLHPNQFILRGGLPAIITWLNAEIPMTKVVLTTDVPSCFFSLIRERVEVDMPLPRAVTRSVLFDPMDRAMKSGFFLQESKALSSSPNAYLYGCGVPPAWGIPRGSALASLAAEVSLKPILDAVDGAAEGVRVATYGDNFIILAPSVKAAGACKLALLEAASERISAKAVAGLCTRIEMSTPNKGFRFLQSNFSLKNGVLQRRYPPGIEDAFAAKLWGDFINKDIDRVTAVRRLKGFVNARSYDPKSKKFGNSMMGELGFQGIF
jgi:hypothetical protein